MGRSRRRACPQPSQLGTAARRCPPCRKNKIPHAANLMSNEPNNLKKVLFVDDNLQFLEMIERLMGNWSKGEWQIFLAQNSGKALLILQEHAIDLAVVDVQMPVVDVIQFLALLNRKYPA